MAKSKYIDSPEKMWVLFIDYRNNCKSNPIKVHDFVGKDGDSVERKKERPLTMEGFECYVMNELDIKGIDQYFSNQNELYNDYVGICSRIRKCIRADQIEGGMVGIYNPSITQRLNGLKELSETEHKGSLNIPGLPDIGNRK